MFDELSQGLVGKPVKSNQAIVNFLMNSRKGMAEAFTGQEGQLGELVYGFNNFGKKLKRD